MACFGGVALVAVWPRQMRPFPPVALLPRAARPHTAGFPRGSFPSSSFSSSQQDLHAGELPQDRGMRGGAATQICPCQNSRTFRCPTPRSQHGRFPAIFPAADGPRGRARLRSASPDSRHSWANSMGGKGKAAGGKRQGGTGQKYKGGGGGMHTRRMPEELRGASLCR